jgi:tRNA-Thr(GGU) m(6)t(6)A37 methyltransferase TsaA
MPGDARSSGDDDMQSHLSRRSNRGRHKGVAPAATVVSAAVVLITAKLGMADSNPDANAALPGAGDGSAGAEARPTYELNPIGWVRKANGRTSIELYDEYGPALFGVDALDHIWVLYWFDRNDTPEQRAILRVHPRGNPANQLRGVFATRAPMRPNPIALSRCRVLGVHDNVIEIEDLDAFPDTPVLDIKP